VVSKDLKPPNFGAAFFFKLHKNFTFWFNFSKALICISSNLEGCPIRTNLIVMNCLLPKLLITSFFLLWFSSCKKNNEPEFYIEATINGVRWQGKSTGDYLAIGPDNSQMKIFVGNTQQGLLSFTFFNNASLAPFYWNDTDFKLQNGYIAPFDSKLRIKWETTFENNVAKYYIQQSVSNPESFENIDSINGSGSGTYASKKVYSMNLPDVKPYYLNQAKYRFYITFTGGGSFYTATWPAAISSDKAQIVYVDPVGKVFFPLDNDQNQLTVSDYNLSTGARRGTFYFNFKDESGNIIAVRNGKFHLK
jgi:hypothetical protein